jgi:hypothetical protein
MTFLKNIAAIIVILALSAGLTIGVLWVLYMVFIISLFYIGAMYFLIGAVFTGIFTWFSLKVFDRRKVYSIRGAKK